MLIIDEFRMVSKGVIDTILRKFLTSPRRPQYMNDPQYKDRADLREPNKTLYLSQRILQGSLVLHTREGRLPVYAR